MENFQLQRMFGERTLAHKRQWSGRNSDGRAGDVVLPFDDSRYTTALIFLFRGGRCRDFDSWNL